MSKIDKIFRAMAHPIRRQIIEYLLEKNTVTFSELMKYANLGNHGKFGFHLRVLKKAELVNQDPSTKKFLLTVNGQLFTELL